MKNEFEEFNEDDVAPKAGNTPGSEHSPIASGSPGITYDWTQAPDGTKAPPRVNLDGKIVMIKKADIILPPQDRPWEKSRKGDKDLKACTFTLYYSEHSQQENYSGVRVFKRENNLYSHPTITRDRKNQASQLLGKYADFKKKDINEVSLREFLGFLNSHPKVKISKISYTNPDSGAVVEKNMVSEFVE